jgi:hypothetical protein
MKEDERDSQPVREPPTQAPAGAATAGERRIRLFSEWDGDVSPFKPRGAPAERVIISYGFPGSGSTLVWQILNFLFGNVKKTASCPIYRDNSYVVATVRDFRDILCTYLARTNMDVCRENIDQLVSSVAQTEGVFAERELLTGAWKVTDGRIMWMRYEDFFNNYEYIFERITTFLQRPISAEEKQQVITRFNHESNRARARKAADLSVVDDGKEWLEKEWHSYVVDGINAKHITSDGAPGKWRRIIPEDLHDYVTELLREPLQRFGYV